MCSDIGTHEHTCRPCWDRLRELSRDSE
jgi:hypothetical protein